MGLSTREFVNCAQDFVENKSVQKYWPSGEDVAPKLEQWTETQADQLSVRDGWLCLERAGKDGELYLVACRQIGNELQMKVVPSRNPNLLCGTAANEARMKSAGA
jgi:hypothetical protein